jgi:RNA polymerase sigma-70 factor (ECF subfamily)
LDTEKNRIIKAKKDLQEFDYLYRKYYPIMNNFIFHRVNDEAVRNEIVSNVFFKAMKRLSLFRFLDSRKCSFSSWLYRIAVNEVNQFYRNVKRENKIRDSVKWNTVDGDDIQFNYEIVQRKIAAFKIDEQNLITLRFFEKLSYKEIAEIYNKKEGTIKVQMHRLLRKLRMNIEKEIENERS